MWHRYPWRRCQESQNLSQLEGECCSSILGSITRGNTQQTLVRLSTALDGVIDIRVASLLRKSQRVNGMVTSA